MPPNRLFKYQPLAVGSLSNLERDSIWFSKPEHFNDPFDCNMIPTVRDQENPVISLGQASYTLDQWKSAARKKWGVASFSTVACAEWEPPDHKPLWGTPLLMWSHYAASHTGFCLQFDGAFDPFAQAKEVCYKENVGELSLSSIANEDEEFKRAMFLTKAKCWCYESEWRIIDPKGDTLETYAPETLKAIYLGTAMNTEYKCLIKQILRG